MHQSSSDHRNRLILEAMPGLLFVLDKAGTFQDWRGQPAQLKFQPAQFLGQHLETLFPKPFSRHVQSQIETTLGTGAPGWLEYVMDREAGGFTGYEVRMVPFAEETVLALVTESAPTRWQAAPPRAGAWVRLP